MGAEPSILANIYDDDVDIAIWQRELSVSMRASVAQFVAANPTHKTAIATTPEHAQEALSDSLRGKLADEVCANIAELVDMFCLLFDLKQAGLRLSVLDTAMCPRFHVDRIPCRLLTTYQGVATEWLARDVVDRSRLGHASDGRPDHESGLFPGSDHIQRLNAGDVALLKGDLWAGDEGRGLVHRSPDIADANRRLLMTLDFVD
jgi:hypothetical protein